MMAGTPRFSRISTAVVPTLAFLFLVLRADLQADDANSKRRTKATRQRWDYLDNGRVRIGVDKSRGACIGFLGNSRSKRNLLNHYDAGRFVQQSYYGAPDGSKWNGKPWVYNPVQGGSWKGKASRLLDFRKDNSKQTLYAKVEPLRWSSGIACPEAIMEQTISLDQSVARIHYRMKYTGKDQSVVKDQEMPAVFVDAELANLVYVDRGQLKRRIPKWPNEPGTASENWVAYLDDKDRGLGIYTPGTNRFTCYRARGDGKTGPTGSACSYVALLRRFSLQNGRTVEYDVYLTVGSLREIRGRFAVLRQRVARVSAPPMRCSGTACGDRVSQ